MEASRASRLSDYTSHPQNLPLTHTHSVLHFHAIRFFSDHGESGLEMQKNSEHGFLKAQREKRPVCNCPRGGRAKQSLSRPKPTVSCLTQRENPSPANHRRQNAFCHPILFALARFGYLSAVSADSNEFTAHGLGLPGGSFGNEHVLCSRSCTLPAAWRTPAAYPQEAWWWWWEARACWWRLVE